MALPSNILDYKNYNLYIAGTSRNEKWDSLQKYWCDDQKKRKNNDNELILVYSFI